MALDDLKKEDKAMTQFLREAKAITDDFAAAGKPLRDEDFCASIFRLFGNDYISSYN